MSNGLYAQTRTITVNITNIGSLDTEALLQATSVYRYREYPELTDKLVERLSNKGINELKTALQTLGYYRASISLNVSKSDDDWIVNYAVDLGPPIIISKVEINLRGAGEEDELLKKWKNNYPLHPSDILNQLTYENAKTELLRILFNRGYFSYEFQTHKIVINPNDNLASIEFDIFTGNRYKIGGIYFKQKTPYFSDKYLSHFLDFKSGDYFLNTTLISTQQNFTVSDEFQNIEIEPLISKKVDDAVPIDITLEMRKPLKIQYGIGYGTDTGPRASGSIERRHITRNGHRANASFQYSKVKSVLNIGYKIPLTKPYSDFLSLNGERYSEDSNISKSQKSTFSIKTSYSLSSWLRTAFINYEHEHYEISNEIDDSILLIPGIRFDYLNKNTPNKQQIYWQFNISLKGAYDRIVSDTSFAQLYTYGWLRLPLSRKDRLIVRSSIGHSRVSELQELPTSQRFFAGGDYSIRGYSYNSLGPKDSTGTVVGGENLLVGSVEYQRQIKDGFVGSIFYDTGNAFNKNDLVLKSGSGVGIGWYLPFGSIYLYRAEALSEPDHPWRYHLTVGAEF